MSADFAALMAELLAEFLDELPSRCNDLEEAILQLETGEPDAFDELYRQVHSLKGTGGGVGIPVITTICHQFESFLSDVRHRFDRNAANTALAYVDLVRRTIPPSGREAAGLAAIEQSLDTLRALRLSGRISLLVVEPSQALRRMYQDEFATPHIRAHILENGMHALERLLHEAFDMLIISRELSGLNGLAVVAALREARCRNSDIPAILVSSNTTPAPAHLKIHSVARRDMQLVPGLLRTIDGLRQRRSPA
jgi:CheY-like chemotaxis protein